MLTIENLYILVAALALICVVLAAFCISANLKNAKQREAFENLQDELKDSERLNIEQRAKLEASSDKINELAKNLDEYKISLKQKDEKEDELERELRRLNEELGSQTKMMADMISGVVVVKSASMADETMPLPYCSEPMRAFALPFIS